MTQKHEGSKKQSTRQIDDPTVDSSVSLTFITGAFSAFSEEVRNSMAAVIDKLWIKTNTGGLARYENDDYYRVTRAFLETLGSFATVACPMVHCYCISLEELNRGLSLLNWAAKHASPSGMLAEQINPHTGNPLSVSPLVWSHAEFVIAVCEYIEKQKELSLIPENESQWRKVL